MCSEKALAIWSFLFMAFLEHLLIVRERILCTAMVFLGKVFEIDHMCSRKGVQAIFFSNHQNTVNCYTKRKSVKLSYQRNWLIFS